MPRSSPLRFWRGGIGRPEPLAWLCGIALALSAAGLTYLRRRDLGDLGPSPLTAPLRDRIADYIQESDEVTLAASGRAAPPPSNDS